MSASVGDRIRMHSNSVDTPDRVGTIVGVLGADDGPPYRVRFESGEESIVSPGPDATIESPGLGEKLGMRAEEARGDAAEAAAKAKEVLTEAGQAAKDRAETAAGTAARVVSDVADRVAKRFER